MKIMKIAGAAFASALMSACTSIPPGATAIPADDIKSSLSGRSWLWDIAGKGAGIYFAGNGTAVIHLEGKNYDTTWSTRDGAFCYKGPDKDRCWALYARDGRTYSKSLWQPEYSDEYPWDARSNTVPGRRIG